MVLNNKKRQFGPVVPWSTDTGQPIPLPPNACFHVVFNLALFLGIHACCTSCKTSGSHQSGWHMQIIRPDFCIAGRERRGRGGSITRSCCFGGLFSVLYRFHPRFFSFFLFSFFLRSRNRRSSSTVEGRSQKTRLETYAQTNKRKHTHTDTHRQT